MAALTSTPDAPVYAEMETSPPADWLIVHTGAASPAEKTCQYTASELTVPWFTRRTSVHPAGVLIEGGVVALEFPNPTTATMRSPAAAPAGMAAVIRLVDPDG